VPSDFETALAALDGVHGWLTDAQARRLFEHARALPADAQVVEIGSYRGRSAILMAHARGPGATIVAIDPHAGNDRGPQQVRGTAAEGEADHRAFRANLARAGVADRVRHIRRPSQEALAELDGEIDLLYVDGAHRYRPASADLVRWGSRVRPGGRLLVHDAFGAVGVTLALARHVFLARDFRYERRTGSLAEYVRAPVTGPARVRNVLRQMAQLPWFARNQLVKIAILAGLRPLARALGHREGPWPY
jgi:predicted O-methyltransferase YrrM